jgi:hypothetical protein
MKAGRHINLTGDYSWRQNKRVEKGFPELVRSWRRFGERGIWLPSGLVQRILE